MRLMSEQHFLFLELPPAILNDLRGEQELPENRDKDLTRIALELLCAGIVHRTMERYKATRAEGMLNHDG